MTSDDVALPSLDGEDAAVERLRRIFANVPDDALRIGPGHDCASIAVGDHDEVVVTSDVLVDGVHFDVARHGAESAGAKALLVNLSDLAAAAARPLAFEAGVVLPRDGAADLLDGLARGLARVASTWSCPAAGGDMNVGDGPLVIAVTAFGLPGRGGVLTRTGARAGDVLSVTGPLGGSRAGRHLDFTPRLREAEALAACGVPHAMMDLSDGLARDLPRMLRASDVGAVVDAARVPVHPDVASLADGRPALEHALGDGEDFELLVAHAPLDEKTERALAQRGVRLVRIGEIRPVSEGLRLVEGERSRPWPDLGYDHLRCPPSGPRDRIGA